MNTLSRDIPLIMSGGNVSLFCYGHTGTGKTHTTMGYDGEPGQFLLASDYLIKEIAKKNEALGLEGIDKMRLSVRFTEVFMGEAYDLLKSRRKLVFLESENNGFQLMCEDKVVLKLMKGEMTDKGVKEDAFVNEFQEFVLVDSVEELKKIMVEGVKSRACGSSRVHDQSSRSHAVLEMEISTERVWRMRKLREEIDAFLSWMDNNKMLVPSMMPTGIDGKPLFEVTEMKRKGANNLRRELMKKLKEIRTTNRDLHKRFGKHGMFGSMILVDLAGADKLNDTRGKGEEKTAEQEATMTWKGTFITPAEYERKTTAFINKELFVLKECLTRSAAGESRIPYRDCNLTKVLQNVVTPKVGQTSQVYMVVNVSPGERMERDTMNTLRYGQMVTGVKEDKKKTSEAGRARDLRRQIIKLYAEYAPEKSRSELNNILTRFAGREMKLLRMARKKYAK